jgi:hypothetical protein
VPAWLKNVTFWKPTYIGSSQSLTSIFASVLPPIGRERSTTRVGAMRASGGALDVGTAGEEEVAQAATPSAATRRMGHVGGTKELMLVFTGLARLKTNS